MLNSNKGIRDLAKVLDNRMKEHKEGEMLFDFGEIQSDWSLLMNTFPMPIPKSDYSVCRLLSGIRLRDGDVSVTIPKLKKGDRVLCVMVEGEPVVIDVVMQASRLEG